MVSLKEIGGNIIEFFKPEHLRHNVRFMCPIVLSFGLTIGLTAGVIFMINKIIPGRTIYIYTCIVE